MPDIHITDVQTFKTCRQRWDYSSLMRKGLEPNRMYGPFVTGRAIHSALEALYLHNTPPVQTVSSFFQHTREEMEAAGTFERQALDFGDELELSLSMASYYDHWRKTYKGPFNDADLEFVSMETEFRVPLQRKGGRSDIVLAGRFDGVVRHLKDDSLWLLETKTASNSFDRFEDYLDRSEQAIAYTIAAQYTLAKPVTGVLYNILRKKVIEPPKVLKSGMLSQNKSQDIPVDYYLKFIREHHANDFRQMVLAHNGADMPVSDFIDKWIMTNYGDTVRAMLDNPREFVKRTAVRFTDEEKRTFSRGLWAVANEMADPNIPIYRNEGPFTCQWCMFKRPCAIAKAGGDEATTLALDYRPRTREAHIAQLEVM